MALGERPRAREEWVTDPPTTEPDAEAQCRNEGWTWTVFRNRVATAHYPAPVYCQLPKGHDGEHATRSRRRSWLWYPGKWRRLRW